MKQALMPITDYKMGVQSVRFMNMLVIRWARTHKNTRIPTSRTT